MKHAARAALGVVWACVVALPAIAQDHLRPNPFVLPSKIDIKYEPVDNDRKEKLQPVIDLLQKQQVLERLRQFLAPLKLKRNLLVRTADCGDGRYYMPYKPDGPVTICYQFVQLIETLAPKDGQLGVVGTTLVSRDAARVGPFVQEVLHDVALAVFDIQPVPVWGGAEFAADNVAAFLLLQFGTDVALKTVLGTAYFLNSMESAIASQGYSFDYLVDIRPTLRQRYYNTLCVAFGSDGVKFGMFRAVNRAELVQDLPSRLQGNCVAQFGVLRQAFVKTIVEPHVDPELQKQVLAAKWLD